MCLGGYEHQHAAASKSQARLASKNGKRLRSYASGSCKTGLGIAEARGSTSCLVKGSGDPSIQDNYKEEGMPAHVYASPRIQEDSGSAAG